jgi:hypothetical protein
MTRSACSKVGGRIARLTVGTTTDTMPHVRLIGRLKKKIAYKAVSIIRRGLDRNLLSPHSARDGSTCSEATGRKLEHSRH